jgi:DNA polymerase-4/protein ImuB
MLAEPGEPLIVPENETAAFLAPLSIDLLPVSEEMRARLARFGIGTLGELAALPVTAVQAQFGPEGRRAWALAGGAERERPVYQPPTESIAQALTFPAPATGVATLRIALEHLLAQAFARPERKGRGVRQVRILMRLEEGSRWERLVTLREPSIDHYATARSLFPLLDGLELSGAVEEMAIVLTGFAAEGGRQEGLFAEKGKRLRQLAASLKQLTARYQHPMLARVVEVEPWSRIPENRLALIDYDP